MKKVIGFAVIGIMFFSTIAFAVVQSFYVGQNPGAHNAAQQDVELPGERIIDYRLSPAQFNFALSSGLTVATYTYDLACAECAEERQFVEQLVLSQDFQDQIILEEVQRSGASRLEVTSAFGSVVLNETDPDGITDAFCQLAVSPPLGCAVRQQG